MKFGRSGIAAAALAALTLGGAVAQAQCNGYSEFCSRQYSKVSMIGAHNSYAISPGNIAANQNYTVKTQLDNGVRMLQVQGHMNDGELHLCHTSCLLLDAGKFSDYLSTVKSWLDDNKNEVITILMVNSDGIEASVWAQAYSDSGLASYAYQPSSVPVAYDSWPTLQEMIDSGKRVVNFLAQGADMSTAPYLLDEFTHMWETPFSQTDPSFPCTVDRVTGDYQGKMYLINHNLNVNKTLLGQTIPVPAVNELAQTNAATGTGSLGAQAQTCETNWGYKPTFTLVDYYDVGDGSVFQYAASLNGVSYNAVQIGNGTAGQSDGTTRSAGGAVESRPLGAAASLHVRTVLELAALSKVVQDLCASVDGALRLAPSSSKEQHPSRDSNRTFRRPVLSTHPLSSTLHASNEPHVEAQFESFRMAENGPRSQIEALPPLSTFALAPVSDSIRPAHGPRSFPPASTTLPWAAHELTTPPNKDEPSSAFWNPEQETLHYLSSSMSSHAPSSFSSCSNSPARGRRVTFTSDLPSSDDAASYLSAATTAQSAGNSSCDEQDASQPSGDTGSTSCSRERNAHPLTMRPSLDSAWDFDRLFSKKRTWYGGARTFDDDAVENDDMDEKGVEADNEDEGSRRGRNMVKGKLKCRKSALRNEMTLAPNPERATTDAISSTTTTANEHQRQQEVFETMRKAAMERLALLGAHLAWTGSHSKS
ncbi:hypothetical protein OIV83_000175 [Microbotryomycetes sp. JL201]|nr:hypothetical protein OIV83_000175 [Microbotryomycetes sp. JL201]